MNYLPFVSWGLYGATSASERASFFSSWGLLDVLPESSARIISPLFLYQFLKGIKDG